MIAVRSSRNRPGPAKPVWALPVTFALTLVGLIWRWPSATYQGPTTQSAFNDFAFDRFVYTDVVSLFFRDGLSAHPIPYLDYQFEYPVGTGLFVYVANTASSLPVYYWVTWTALAVCAVVIAAMIPRFKGETTGTAGSVWLFALSPAVALYVNFNWDMLALVMTVGALLAFARGRDSLSGGLLAAGVWTKFFPVVMLPVLLIARIRTGATKAALRLAGWFVAVTVAINLPLLVVRPRAWWHFFALNAQRTGDLNLWSLLVPLDLSAFGVDVASAGLLGLGIAGILAVQWRATGEAWLPGVVAAITLFFAVNKVYSPQYGLWVVVLLAVVGASTGLAVAWSAMDLAYFTTSFVVLGLTQFDDGSVGWFVEHALQPVATVRVLLLLGLAVWALTRMRRPPVERSRASPPPAAGDA